MFYPIPFYYDGPMILQHDEIIVPVAPEEICDASIGILDDDSLVLKSTGRHLRNAGFRDVRTAQDTQTALALAEDDPPHLFVIDINLGKGKTDGINFLARLRSNNYKGIAVIYSANFLQDNVFRAASAGANDFLVKGEHLFFPVEIIRILNSFSIKNKHHGVRTISDLAYLRSFKLTNKEVELLIEFSRGNSFPPFKLLAGITNMQENQVRNYFSKIYRKLGIINRSHLINRLIICKLFCHD